MPELENVPPEDAQRILDRVWAAPSVQEILGKRVRGVRIGIAILIAGIVAYLAHTGFGVNVNVVWPIQTASFVVAVAWVGTVLVQYDRRMSQELRRLVRREVENWEQRLR